MIYKSIRFENPHQYAERRRTDVRRRCFLFQFLMLHSGMCTQFTSSLMGIPGAT